MRHFGILCLTVFVSASVVAQTPSSEAWLDSLTKLSDYTPALLARLYIPLREHRKSIRRDFQRRGYANVLLNVIEQDGFSALISFIKMKLQTEYSLDHSPIAYRISRKQVEIVPEDWSFPVDPWKRDENVFIQ